MANIHVANRHSLPPSPVTPSSPNSVSFPPGTLNSSQQLKSKRDFRKAASSAALLQTSELSNSSSSSSGVTNRREGAGKKAISSPLIGPIPNISPQGSDLQSLDPQIRAFITSNNLEHFSAVLSPNVSTLDDILNITDQDLVRWGITSQANRRMIQVAIAAHKAKLLQTETIKASTKGPDAYVLQTNGPQTPIPRTPVGGRRVVSSTLIEPPKSQHNELDDWKWIRSDRAKAT
ncbi:hypothetical protein BJ742DRAFT_387747 [Cladochytrium replicatum]|nr:hypothetical protein BJ742DRAFT_387747 [Cladochytrium replicatum]